MVTRSGMFGWMIGLALAAAATNATAAPLQTKDVPAPLKPWVDWALRGHEEELCPFLDGAEERTCVWPSRLTLTLDDRGGRFSQEWQVYDEAWVPLPGDAERWPVDVRVGNKAAVVAPDDSERPAVLLPPGHHLLTGAFLWDSLPESLSVPQETGVVSLMVRGARIAFPQRGDDGELFLERRSTQEEDDLRVVTHRRVFDDVPLQLSTRIVLEVSGKSREVLLGRALPAGFVPLSLEGELPARLEPDGRVRVQVRPGRWELTVVARHDGPVTTLTRPEPRGPWSDGDEIWVFEARPPLRTATVTGVPAVDPQQTTLPDEWKKLPAYAMAPGAVMTVIEQQRGDAAPPPDRLRLERTMWLDFDGGGYTMRDQIDGTLSRSWRLELPQPAQLGRVTVRGEDQLITQLPGGQPGVEVRQGLVSLRAESRWPAAGGEVPAVSWRSDFEQVSTDLQLPPGWRLLHASGADEVGPTWIQSWTLLDLFLLLLTSLAVAKLYGPVLGIVALLAALLVFPENDAPKVIWLAILAGVALRRILRPGKLAWLVRLYIAGAWVVAATILVPFVVQQLRHGLHPALERPDAGRMEALASQLTATNEAPAAQAEPVGAPKDAEQAVSANATLGGLSVAGVGMGAGEPSEQTVGKPGAMRKGERGMAHLAEKHDEDAVAKAAGAKGWRKPARSSGELLQSLARLDPNAVVQTGPGIPQWRWSSVRLAWRGPVDQAQRVRLLLLPPWVNMALACGRVALLALLVVGLLGWPRWRRRGALPTTVMAALALVVALLPGAAAADDLPSDELLEHLRERMLERPSCAPDCVSISRLGLEISGRRMRVRLEVGAAARTAVALPGTGEQWAPESVHVDGHLAAALTRSEGALWVALEPGGHMVVGEGLLPDRDTVQLSMPMKPHHVAVRADGWVVEGVHEDGAADSTLQLTRVRSPGQDGASALQPGALPPLVRVSRALVLGLRWQVETRVARLSPRGTPIVVEVPLLPGESVTTAGMRVAKGKAQVNMAAQQDEVAWSSTLEERSPLELQAVRALAVVEEWFLAAEPIWHVSWSGLAPTVEQATGAPRTPTWRPWPGEKLTLDLTRPPAVSGQTLTIEGSDLELSPGSRAADASLTVKLRSSRGGQHALGLPAGAQVTSLTVNGVKLPVQINGGALNVPLSPGEQTIAVSWREADGMRWHYRAPAVNLGAPGVNSTVSIHPAGDRWTLLVGGPRLGPAVLFWSLLLALLVVAVGLSRWRITPLRLRDWLLLGIGLSQVDAPLAVVVAGWLIVFGWRRRLGARTNHWLHDLLQIGLVGLTVAAALVLVEAIRQGLLGQADMQIAGNGSSTSLLRWFQDRSGPELARPWMISVPYITYRLAMLAWALWLATALLRWARWLWACFGEGGLWKPLFKHTPTPRAPEPPPDSDTGVPQPTGQDES